MSANPFETDPVQPLSEEWREEALCAQTDPEAFFPEKGGSTREAKEVCEACDVREQCLAWALASNERFGIWGGLSTRERDKLKKAEAAAGQPIAVSARTQRVQTVLERAQAGVSAAEIGAGLGITERSVHRILAADRKSREASATADTAA